MISFWVTKQGSFGILNYRSHRGFAIRDRFETFLYEEIGQHVNVPLGPVIFAALEQLTETQRNAAGRIWDAHADAAPAVPRLNDPRRVLTRFDLLSQLHREGLNSFRVYRASQMDAVERFPVFVRHIDRHDGPATGLIETSAELRRVLLALRMRGRSLDEHMIVEFCDASGPDGLFRKYAAFKVGDRVLPCHLFTSREWCVKSLQNRPTEASLQDAAKYCEVNPHEAWLRRVFAVAGIDYGRADYGVAHGAPQLWEINLNPTIGRAAGESRHSALAPELKEARDSSRELFHQQLMSAFLALDEKRTLQGHVVASLDAPLLERLRQEAALRLRRERRVQLLTRLYESPRLGRPVRAVYSLFPRR